MSEEITQNLPDERSFEDRVLARFDAFDARFDSIDARFDSIDARFDSIDARFESIDARLEKLESRNYDTKPIWERALKAIMETGLEVGHLKTNVGVIETKVDGIETRLSVLESEVASMRGDYARLRSELVETQRDFKMKLTRRLDLVLTTLVDTRDGLRDADERLTQLESKLA